MRSGLTQPNPQHLHALAYYGQGWIPLGPPDARTAGQLERLHDYLRTRGRDPQAFGIEAWGRSSIGNPDHWRDAAARWQALGATHLTFYTSGQGVGAVPQQIDAMRQFHEAVR